jgi:hypothetical protein
MRKLLLIAICIILSLPVLNAQTNTVTGNVTSAEDGLATREIPVDGRTTVDVVLEMEKIQLEEIVVTALGMKREKKALGYSVQEVDGAEVQATKELNVINSLAGRAEGVIITRGLPLNHIPFLKSRNACFN